VSLNIDILNTLIRNQKDAIKYQSVFALIVVIIGCSLIVVSNFFLSSNSPNDNYKLVMTIGGGFISTISAFPINQIILRREKIKTYNILKLKLNDITKTDLKKIEDLIWKSLEKVV